MFDIIGKKNYFFALSAIITIVGIIGYIVHGGFNLDIQFQGGTIMEIQTNDGNFDIKKAEQVVKDAIGKKASVQESHTYDTNNSNQIMYFMIVNVASKDTLNGEEQNKVVSELKKEFNIKEDAEMRVRNVHPSIGKELLGNGLKAVFWLSVLIIVYIWWRFKIMSGLSAGVTAVLALLHDALIMLAVYSILNIPLNESFIAAVLTIIGYSMNDTIIIYDRIRENSNLLRKVPIAELVNRSILQTLSRSINTVVTVLICVITAYIFATYYGIETIREFTLPLIVGIASGCYSSIFIASPLWVMWKEAQAKKKIASRPAKA